MPANYQYARAQQTNVSGTGAVNIINVPVASSNFRFRDMVSLTITTTNAAAATLTISDGTATPMVLNYPNAASAPTFALQLFFDPPLQQTGLGNLAWTCTASVNASGFNVTAQFVER
jgi:hypothetical protein